jgi:hypothetical protein
MLLARIPYERRNEFLALVNINLEKICRSDSSSHFNEWETQIRYNFVEFKNSVRAKKYLDYVKRKNYINRLIYTDPKVGEEMLKNFMEERSPNDFLKFRKMQKIYEKQLRSETQRIILLIASLLVFYYESNDREQETLTSHNLYNEFIRSVFEWQESKLNDRKQFDW